MKIAICVGTMELGGAINSVTYITQGLENLGHECTVIVTHHRPGSYYPMASKRFKRVKHLCAGEFWLRGRLKKTFEGLRGFDFIINNHSKELAMLGSLFYGFIPQISVIRGVSPVNFKDAIRNSPYLDALVAISPSVEKGLENHSACPVHLIPNAVVPLDFDLPELRSKVIISYLGRVVNEDKNVLIIPEVSKSLDGLGIDHEIVIVGDGRDLDRLNKKAKSLEVSQNIRIMGFKEKEEAMSIIAETQLMICPSNHEGFGLYVAEAMAMGVVPIVSPLEVFTWMLGDQARHLQVKHNSGSNYAEIISLIISDSDNYYRIQHENKKRWQNNFTLKRLIVDYNEMISEISVKPRMKRDGPVLWSRPVGLRGFNALRYTRLYKCCQIAKRVLSR